jgi:tetratricopeptide (TPR) repeat protein
MSAKVLAKEAGEDLLAHRIDMRLGNVFHVCGQLEEAFQLLEDAYQALKAVGDWENAMEARRTQAVICGAKGKSQEKEALIFEVLEWAKQAGNHFMEARCYNSLGIIADVRGDLSQKSVEMYSMGLAIAERYGYLSLSAMLQGNLGIHQWQQGNYAAAEQHFLRALSLAEQTGDKTDIAYDLYLAGFIAIETGNLKAASDHTLRLAAVVEKLAVPKYRAGHAALVLRLEITSGDESRISAALEKMEAAFAKYAEVADIEDSPALAYLDAAQYYRRAGRMDRAGELAQKAATAAAGRRFPRAAEMGELLASTGSPIQ